jgi:hypothetical protein
LQTIRTWDWRAAIVEGGSPPVDAVATTALRPTARTSTEPHAESESLVSDSSPVRIADTQPVVMELTPSPDTGAIRDSIVAHRAAMNRMSATAHAYVESDEFANRAVEIERLFQNLEHSIEAGDQSPQRLGNRLDFIKGKIGLLQQQYDMHVGRTAEDAQHERDTIIGQVQFLGSESPVAVGPVSDAAAPHVEIDSPPIEVDRAEGLLHQDSEPLVRDSSPFQDVADTQPVVMEPRPVPDTGDPPTDAVGPISGAAAPPREIHSAPVEVDPFAARKIEDIGVDLTSWFEHQPEPEPKPEHEAVIRRAWSHRTTKLAVLAMAAIVVVILIVGGIRLFAKSPGSGGTTAATVTRPESRPHSNHVVAPIDAAQMTQYRGYAAGLQSANVAATRGFVHAGSTPTASQVVQVVGAYRTAVSLYNNQLSSIHWPASMQTAIETDHAQLQALTSFLQAFSSVAPNGVPAWLSQLHNRASTTEAADNVVREALGFPASSSFP